MTVQELIFKLAQLPPNAKVFVEHGGMGMGGPFVTKEPVKHVLYSDEGGYDFDVEDHVPDEKVYILHDDYEITVRDDLGYPIIKGGTTR